MPHEEVAPLMGSSPRVRGKLQSLDIDVLKEGLIPACAGKTRPP